MIGICRVTPDVPMLPTTPARVMHDYRRNDTLDLFARSRSRSAG